MATQAYWLDAPLQANDFAHAADRADAMLRAHPLLADEERLLGPIEQSPGGRAALAEHLSSRPPWLAAYLGVTEKTPATEVGQRFAVISQVRVSQPLGCEVVAPLTRELLRIGVIQVGGFGLPAPRSSRATAMATPGRQGPVRACILLYMDGAPSHIDLWDMKPEAPLDYRGLFQPIATSAPGVRLCEHLPLLAKQAHHLAIVNSLGHYGRGTGDHHAGYYYNLTGHAPDPTFGSLGNNRTPRSDERPPAGPS